MSRQFKNVIDATSHIGETSKQDVLGLQIDYKNGSVQVQTESGTETHQLSSPEGFTALSQAWVRATWDAKYAYSFTWMGRPIIQLPDDAFRMQELIYSIKPDVIVETGIALGGSLVFYASLCKAMGKGKIVGVDIEIRPHNRKAIEAHELFPLITLIEGDSVAESILNEVRQAVGDAKTVLVLLDSCHTKEHVLAELKAYAPFVTAGSCIVAMDGIMGEVAGAPRTSDDWSWNNPKEAAIEFLKSNSDFTMEPDNYFFNEGTTKNWITYSPCGVLRRRES